MTVRRCTEPGCPHLLRWAIRCPQHRTADSASTSPAHATAAMREQDWKGEEPTPSAMTRPAPDSGDPGSHWPAGVAATTTYLHPIHPSPEGPTAA